MNTGSDGHRPHALSARPFMSVVGPYMKWSHHGNRPADGMNVDVGSAYRSPCPHVIFLCQVTFLLLYLLISLCIIIYCKQ